MYPMCCNQTDVVIKEKKKNIRNDNFKQYNYILTRANFSFREYFQEPQLQGYLIQDLDEWEVKIFPIFQVLDNNQFTS